MAHKYRTQGIILRKQDMSEADRMFVVFTKDFGKLKLRAISERKITSKLRGGLELFYLSEIEFIRGKTRKTITDALVVERYPLLRSSVERMRVMHRFAEVADEVISGQEPDEKVWNLLGEALRALNRPALEARDLKVLAYYFLWNLLSCAGYSPSLAQIGRQDAGVAEFIDALLRGNESSLHHIDIQGINETLLRAVSQEYLSKVLQN